MYQLERLADLLLIECCNACVVVDAFQNFDNLVDVVLVVGIQVTFLRSVVERVPTIPLS